MPVRLRRFQHIRLSAFSAASVLRMIACTKKQDSPTNAVPMKVSVEAAGHRDVPLDDIRPYHASSGGTAMLVLRRLSRPSLFLATLLLSLSFTSLASSTLAQSSEDAGKDTPLISGAAAFFTRTNGRKATYSPVLAPCSQRRWALIFCSSRVRPWRKHGRQPGRTIRMTMLISSV
jgi:hypothetical protein